MAIVDRAIKPGGEWFTNHRSLPGFAAFVLHSSGLK